MASILSAIRDALPDEALRTHMAERRALHAGGSAIDPTAILTLAALEDCLARGAVAIDQIRVFAGYKQLDLERAGIVRNDQLRPLALRSLARQGATLVVNNVQRLSPELWALACDAEHWLGTPVSLAAVVSFGGQSGIELHYDYGDLIAIQLDGEKQWRFYGEPVRESGRRFCTRDGGIPTEIAGEAAMVPGDVMYVPSGLFHQCSPGPYSLHLGIIAVHPSGGEFARHVADQIRDAEEDISEPFQGFLGAETVAARGEAVKRRMIARIEAADPLIWFADRQALRSRVRGLDLRPEAMAGTATLNVTLGPESTIEGKLRAAGAGVDGTPVAQAMLELLRAGPCAVADLNASLPAHAPAEVNATLGKLVDAGLVRVAP